MKFQKNIITHIPTECLVEDYQSLVKGLKTNDWSEVECVIQCLSDSISRYTEVPEGLKLYPSGNSAVAMSLDNGIITDGNGNDLVCKNGIPLSETEGCTGITGDDPSDPKTCPYFAMGLCSPESCQIVLNDGHTYIPFKYDEELELGKGDTVEYVKRGRRG